MPPAQSYTRSIDGNDLAALYYRTCEAAQALHAQATELLELAERLEQLTESGPARYVSTRANVEARAALEQAEELWWVLEDLGEKLGS